MTTQTTTTATTTTTVNLEGSVPFPLIGMTGRFFSSSSPKQNGATAATRAMAKVTDMDATTTMHQGSEQAQARIQQLEAQIRVLNEKAAAAADKLADYEDEIRTLRSQLQSRQQQQETERPDSSQQQHTSNSSTSSTSSSASAPKPLPPDTSSSASLSTTPPTATAATVTRLSSLTSYLSRRNNNNTSSTTTPPTTQTPPPVQQQQPPPPSTTTTATSSSSPPQPNPTDLQTLLTKEQSLRRAAESQLSTAQSELEELTAALFGQANEMVAEERRARKKLEERVEVLEKRDGEKRRRLERLEGAIKRVERVRGLVG